MSLALRAAALLACLAVLCTGCTTVGPDYAGPQHSQVLGTPGSSGPFQGATGAGFSPEDVPQRWWRLYDAQVLDELIEQAFAANTDLRAARANLERSDAELQGARALRQASVALNVGPSYQQVSVDSYLHAGSVPPVWLLDAGVAISYEVDVFGKLRRTVEAAGADDEAVRAAYDLVKVTVAAQMTSAYTTACSTGEELAVAHRSVELQERASQVTQRLVDAGRSPPLDYLRSAELLEQLRSDIPLLEAQREQALYLIATLRGRPPADFPSAVQACAQAPRLTRPIPVGDGAGLLRRRPDVREAERRLAAATARVGVATAELYPRVSLGASAGSSGAMKDFLTQRASHWGGGPGIHWEANPSRARARIAAADAETRYTLARFDATVLTALRETESALAAYQAVLQRNDSLAQALVRARAAEQQAEALHAGGRTDFLSVLDAQRTRAAADAALAASHAELAASQVRLFLALGGGWE